MDIQKIKELALANGFKLKEQSSGNMDLNAYVYDFANAIEQAAKAQTVLEKDAIIKKLSDQLYSQEMKTSAARTLCETACELLDDYAHQDAMVILNDLEQAMIEAQEPAPLKLGDLVKPIDHRYTLASGCERYPYAYVVNTNPFQLMSEEGDMYWCCTVEAGGYKLIKSNDQLPEAVSLRMIREGLLSPVEAQERSHD